MERFEVPAEHETFLFCLPAFYVAKSDGKISVKEAMSIAWNSLMLGLVKPRGEEKKAFDAFFKDKLFQFQGKRNLEDYDLLAEARGIAAEQLHLAPEQTGLDAPEHEPWPSFQAAVFEFIKGHPGIRCVLGGHNHTNTLGRVHNAVAVSVSAFVSTPFEFKIVEVSEDDLTVTTLDLFAEVGFEARYDLNRAFVQGRTCDRQCRISLSKRT